MSNKKINKINAPFTLPQWANAEPIFDYAEESMKYYNILFELYATTFKWKNLPKEIVRDGGELYLEKCLCSQGRVLFFYDEVLKEYLVHSYAGYGLNFYNQPTQFEVSANNGYHAHFTRENAVPIYNSPYYTGEINTIQTYANKLALCDMVNMVNVTNQKTPYLIRCTEGQRLTMENLFKQIFEFKSKIFADSEFSKDEIEVFELNAPYIAGDVYDLKSKYWQEALNFVGIGSGSQKKERVTVNEQMDSEGEKIAMIETRMTSRKMAAEQINDLFGLNIDVEVRKDLDVFIKLREMAAIDNENEKMGNEEEED